jgi:hypothetical protein
MEALVGPQGPVIAFTFSALPFVFRPRPVGTF